MPPTAPRARAFSSPDGTKLTGSFSLPVDRRLSVLAGAVGLLVLFVMLGFVLSDRGTRPSSVGSRVTLDEKRTSVGDAEAPTGSVEPPPAPNPPAISASTVVLTSEPPKPKASATAKPPSAPSPPPAQTSKPTATPSVAPASPRSGCDPPYTLDANGHRKYKKECL